MAEPLWRSGWKPTVRAKDFWSSGRQSGTGMVSGDPDTTRKNRTNQGFGPIIYVRVDLSKGDGCTVFSTT